MKNVQAMSSNNGEISQKLFVKHHKILLRLIGFYESQGDYNNEETTIFQINDIL